MEFLEILFSFQTLVDVVLVILVFFGLTHFLIYSSTLTFTKAFPLTIVPGMGAIPTSLVIWFGIDYLYMLYFLQPISIFLLLLFWAIKLIDDWRQTRFAIENNLQRGSISIHINMAEAWVLMIWAILALFGDYRPLI